MKAGTRRWRELLFDPPYFLRAGDFTYIHGRLYVVIRVMAPARRGVSYGFERAFYLCELAPWYTRVHQGLVLAWHNRRARAGQRAAERRRLRYEGRDVPNTATCASQQVSTPKVTDQNAAQLGGDIAGAAEIHGHSFNK